MYRSMLILTLVFLFSSCQQDLMEDENAQILGGDITSELAPFFKTFQEEASLHGLTVDYKTANITAEIRLINEGSVAGTCSTNGHNIRDIVIDKSFWRRASPLQREMVVYHELGHCILGRGHSEGAFENGVCQSIMRSGLGSCRDAYNATNRASYIEELFAE